MTTFAQGEIYARKIENLPPGLVPFTERDSLGRWIVSHSESGNHHLLDADGVTVMEQTENLPSGMRILYALVKEPTRLWQDAGVPHGEHHIGVGIFELRIAREYDPIMQQAIRVAD